MSVSHRLAATALLGLALATVTQAQPRPFGPPSSTRPIIVPFPVNPNQQIAPNMTARQAAYNIAVLGRAAQQVPPYLYGYNPYPAPVITSGPVVAGGYSPAMANPYALSTVASTNPYLSSAALGTSPYSLSTTGGGYGTGNPYYFPPSYGGYGGGDGYGSSLQGLAALTSATGQYYNQIQQAKLIQEQARQANIDTARKRLEFEAWYETIKPTAGRLADAQMASDIDRARKGAPRTEVWSGKALNDLLASIEKAGPSRLKEGPNVGLEDETLKSLNLTSGSGGGNAGLLRKLLDKDYRLNWPEALTEAPYEKMTKDLEKDMRAAALEIYQGGDVAADKKRDIRSLYDAIEKKFNDSADDLSPSQYIEAKRYLNQVKAAVRALSDTNVKKYLDKNNTWNAKGKTVAELVDHMSKSGLKFAPAADGDQGAYNAAYQALRSFEAGLNQGNVVSSEKR